MGTPLHTVSRILSAWESKGIVQGGRQKLTVCDPQRLLTIAEGSRDEEARDLSFQQ